MIDTVTHGTCWWQKYTVQGRYSGQILQNIIPPTCGPVYGCTFTKVILLIFFKAELLYQIVLHCTAIHIVWKTYIIKTTHIIDTISNMTIILILVSPRITPITIDICVIYVLRRSFHWNYFLPKSGTPIGLPWHLHLIWNFNQFNLFVIVFMCK